MKLNEEMVFTLETIVDKFGEEMAPYAIGLCQRLGDAFWKCMNTVEADNEADEPGGLAAVGCLHAISTILESVSKLPHLFVHIEPTVLPIMQLMLTVDGQEVFEELLEIASYMTFLSPSISMEMWSIWPLLMEALADWAIDFFPNILVPLENYISRSTTHYLTCKKPDYQQSLWNMLSNIADALYYNASLTLNILQKIGVTTEVFNLWFQMLQQAKKSGARVNFKREHNKKICCLGLTSLLPRPAEQLPGEALDRVFKETLELLVGYKDQVAEAEKEQSKDDDDDDMDDDNYNIENDDHGKSEQRMEKKLTVCYFRNSRHRLVAFLEKAFYSVDDYDDDSSDDDELQSPINEVDPFVFFVDTIKVLQASDPMRFQNLTMRLDVNYQTLASGVAQHAEQRRSEIEKEKLEKVTVAAAAS